MINKMYNNRGLPNLVKPDDDISEKKTIHVESVTIYRYYNIL